MVKLELRARLKLRLRLHIDVHAHAHMDVHVRCALVQHGCLCRLSPPAPNPPQAEVDWRPSFSAKDFLSRPPSCPPACSSHSSSLPGGRLLVGQLVSE